MKVKICGITKLEDAQLCARLGADAVGFVFYPKSKRYIQPEVAKNIIIRLPFFLMKIGVFVDAEPDEINFIAKDIGLNGIQLHGNEPPDYISKIDLPVIKSFRISRVEDFQLTENYANCSILIDSFSHDEFGGTGLSFDWEIIPERMKSKIILSGGVSINNIKKIFETIKPAAVDLSSSVESEPGVKDHRKLIDFFNEFNSLKEIIC
ncbi:MAG: phosphoribosylanthranilate isomerase [Bacteroidetes bacterium]|nr:phosphoribosylanthranilate isomerase [Bacteroidota bacterium]MBU1678759.1 phosphoribosylanthranilate isomerase [Bacteroidota bacterium]